MEIDDDLGENLLAYLSVVGDDEIDERRASARRNRPITKAGLSAGLKALREPKQVSRREVHPAIMERLG